MYTVKYECDFELTPRILEIVNFYAEDLPKYSCNSNINYINTIFLNSHNLMISYYFAFGNIHRIKVKHIEENV